MHNMLAKVTRFCVSLTYSTLVYHAGDFCVKPTHKLLARLLSHITPHWRGIAYELISSDGVEVIECNNQKEEDKCFAMLKRWLQTDSRACVCELINALKVYELNSIVEVVKQSVVHLYKL